MTREGRTEGEQRSTDPDATGAGLERDGGK